MRRVLDSALGHKGHGHLNKARSATPVCCARRHVGMHVHGAMWCICSPCVGHQARFPSPPQLPLPHTARGWVFPETPLSQPPKSHPSVRWSCEKGGQTRGARTTEGSGVEPELGSDIGLGWPLST